MSRVGFRRIEAKLLFGTKRHAEVLADCPEHMSDMAVTTNWAGFVDTCRLPVPDPYSLFDSRIKLSVENLRA
jgi:hypothetical protein